MTRALAAPPMPHPMFAGLCNYCRRPMWRQTKDIRGLLKSNANETTCASCVAWMSDHPGQDPRSSKGNVAERIPAERPESDSRWRGKRLDECRDAPPSLFEPDPFRDERDVEQTPQDRADEWKLRESVVATYCHQCPVIAECRRTALENGYEGIWGGLHQTYMRWTDLETGEWGPSANVRGAARRRMLEQAGDPLGELEPLVATVDTEPTLAELEALEPLVAELVEPRELEAVA